MRNYFGFQSINAIHSSRAFLTSGNANANCSILVRNVRTTCGMVADSQNRSWPAWAMNAFTQSRIRLGGTEERS